MNKYHDIPYIDEIIENQIDGLNLYIEDLKTRIRDALFNEDIENLKEVKDLLNKLIDSLDSNDAECKESNEMRTSLEREINKLNKKILISKLTREVKYEIKRYEKQEIEYKDLVSGCKF